MGGRKASNDLAQKRSDVPNVQPKLKIPSCADKDFWEKYIEPLKALMKNRSRTWKELLQEVRLNERVFAQEFLRNSLAYMMMYKIAKYDMATKTWRLFFVKKSGLGPIKQNVEILRP